ncbi:MAG TPA: alanine racemase [Thermoanaerobaculia bacterium]|nr:alanine racemase [Thermoanaerobaculia bacterium]
MSTAPDTSVSLYRPTIVEVDVDAFQRNVAAVARALPPRSRLIVVLKADGYGHGAVALAKSCKAQNVAMIAVALIEEAIELRFAGVDLPILVLGAITREQLHLVREHHLILGIVAPESLVEAAEFATASGSPLRAHLKLDSGMNRMGLISSDLPAVIDQMRRNPLLLVEALYTHFANASEPADPFTKAQIGSFDAMVKLFAEAGFEPPLHHMANSGATMTGTIREGDFVRVGISLYGAEALDRGASKLEPVMRWRTRILRLKEVEAGSVVGYGTTFKAGRRSRIATIPVGYADGYDRLLSNKGEVLVRGVRAPVVGRVSMDLVTVDVTDIDGVTIGDEVVLLGRQGDEEITAEELAALTSTISYDVFCRISARVPRLYSSEGKLTALHSKFRV